MAKKSTNNSIAEVSTFNINTTIKKFFTGLLMAMAISGVLYTMEFVEGPEFPPEYGFYIPLILAILHAVLNYLKHKDDSETVIEVSV